MPKVDFKIRNVRFEDLNQLCNIYNHFVVNTTITFDTSIKTYEEFAEEMNEIIKEYPFLLVEQNDQILGYAFVSKWKSRRAYNYTVESSIYLDPGSHQKGIGSILYNELITEIKKSKIHSVIAGITLPNDISIRLHEKLGFTKIAQFKEVGYKFEKWLDVGYWELILSFSPKLN